MATNKSNWKHFFLSSLKKNKTPNSDQLYINAGQKGGQVNEPIKLITPTMQVTDQARESLKDQKQLNEFSKSRRRRYRKKRTSKKRKGKKRSSKKSRKGTTKKRRYYKKKKSSIN